MANIFDPQAFFDKTGHFASQGRGLFTLLGPAPKVIKKNTVTDMGWKLLTSGLMAKSVQTAGHNLATFEPFSFSGPTRAHAHTQMFGPLTVEFFMMGQSRQEASSIYNTFVLWHEGIAGPDTVDAQQLGPGNNDPVSDSTLFSVAYYEDYTSNAELKIFSPIANIGGVPTPPVIHNKYFEIYPQAIGGLNTSWESQDAPMTLSVTFEYFYTTSILS